MPRAEGWIGTADQWTQGFGVALVLLNLIVLVVAWQWLRRSETVQAALGLLLVGRVPLFRDRHPPGVLNGMAGMEAVPACGGCDTMTAYVDDLRDPGSEGLAPVHYKNRYIRENHGGRDALRDVPHGGSHPEGGQAVKTARLAIVLSVIGMVLCLWLFLGVAWYNFGLHGRGPAPAGAGRS